MTLLVLGLLIFLGTHSLRMLAPGWREARIRAWGPLPWRALYAAASVLGFALLVIGFGGARAHPLALYPPVPGALHLNAGLTLVALILIAAAYVPGNHLRVWLRHPMLAGTAIWAIGHLLATGRLHDVVLFGAFALWACADFAASRRRDQRAGVTVANGTLAGDVLTVLVGAVLWALIAFWLHARLIGVDVSPL